MKLFKKGELNLLWPFYVESIVPYILHFAWIFMIPYFIELGLSIFQIGILLAVAPLFTLLFEVPTGAFADLYGRKNSVLLGYLLEGLGFISLFFFQEFYLILGSIALIGFGGTFSSGAKEAWVTDLIKSKRKDFLHGYFVKVKIIGGIGLLCAGIVGALFVKHFGLRIIWITGFSSFILSIVFLLFANEHFIKREVRISQSLKNIKKQSLKSISYSKRHPVLFYFLMASAILGFATSFAVALTFTPYLSSLGLKDHYFGYLGSAMALMGVLASIMGSKLYSKGKERNFIISSILIWILIALSIIFVNKLVFVIIVLLGLVFMSSIKSPVERVYFHKYIPSKLRASIGSVESMVLAIIGIISFPLVGLTVDLIGPKYTIFLAGILALPSLIIYYKIKDAPK